MSRETSDWKMGQRKEQRTEKDSLHQVLTSGEMKRENKAFMGSSSEKPSRRVGKGRVKNKTRRKVRHRSRYFGLKAKAGRKSPRGRIPVGRKP